MIRKFAAVISILLIFEGAQADEACTPKDFRALLGSPRRQGNSGWCFAHSAADLVAQQTGIQISAFDLGIQSQLANHRTAFASLPEPLRKIVIANPNFEKEIIEARADQGSFDENTLLAEEGGVFDEGGEETTALLMAQGLGACLRTEIPDESEDWNRYSTYLTEIREAVSKLTATQKEAVAATFVDSTGKIPKSGRASAAMALRWADQRCRQRVRLEPMLPKSLAIATSSRQFLQKIKANPFKVRRDQIKLFQEINRRFDADQMVAIGYNAYDIHKPQEIDQEHEDHSVTLVARRKMNGVCEYLLRDHFECDFFKPEYKARCVDGSLWIRASDVPSLYSVVWLEKLKTRK